MRKRFSEEEIKLKLPIWNAFQYFFVLSDDMFSIEEIAEACINSDFLINELHEIFFKEVFPAFRFELLFSILTISTPMETGYDFDDLTYKINKKNRHGKKLPLIIFSGYSKRSWKKLKELIVSIRGY